jgi:hypothetical protein
VAQILLQPVYKKGRDQFEDIGKHGRNITISSTECIFLGRLLPLFLKFYTVAHISIKRSSSAIICIQLYVDTENTTG